MQQYQLTVAPDRILMTGNRFTRSYGTAAPTYLAAFNGWYFDVKEITNGSLYSVVDVDHAVYICIENTNSGTVYTGHAKIYHLDDIQRRTLRDIVRSCTDRLSIGRVLSLVGSLSRERVAAIDALNEEHNTMISSMAAEISRLNAIIEGMQKPVKTEEQ